MRHTGYLALCLFWVCNCGSGDKTEELTRELVYLSVEFTTPEKVFSEGLIEPNAIGWINFPWISGRIPQDWKWTSATGLDLQGLSESPFPITFAPGYSEVITIAMELPRYICGSARIVPSLTTSGEVNANSQSWNEIVVSECVPVPLELAEEGHSTALDVVREKVSENGIWPDIVTLSFDRPMIQFSGNTQTPFFAWSAAFNELLHGT